MSSSSGSGTLARLAEGNVARSTARIRRRRDAFAELRARRGRPEQPLVAVVTAGGSFDPAHPVLEAGALVLTTDGAAPGLRASVPDATEVVAVNDGESGRPRAPPSRYCASAATP